MEALAACRELSEAHPEDVDVQHLLGRILTRHGNADLAVLVLEGVNARRPRDTPALISLARAHVMAREPERAREVFEQALAVDPASVKAHIGLGDVSFQLGDDEAALAAYYRAAELDHADGVAQFGRATTLVQLGRIEEAREAYAVAVRLTPGLVGGHASRADAYRLAGAEGAATRILEAGVVLRPADVELRHRLAASRGDPSLARASDAYLRQHFNRFASSFDERLAALGYRPDTFLAYAQDEIAARAGDLDVLDAGCGTGLCAPALRLLARRLVGVDLASEMLGKASERGLYDELHEAELSDFLLARPARFDLIAAFDLFIYFGHLGEIVTAMAGALRPEGVLVCSLERAVGDDVSLRSSGRWAHSSGHLLEVGASAGLRFTLHEIVVRHEFGEPVPGMAAVGIKKS